MKHWKNFRNLRIYELEYLKYHYNTSYNDKEDIEETYK
jgi:hypothetical protein